MTKWFDTNYHYLVPEFEPGMKFKLASTAPVDPFRSGRVGHPHPAGAPRTGDVPAAGQEQSGKTKAARAAGQLLPIYEEVLGRLADAGADWVQIDEPILALDLPAEALHGLESAYARLAGRLGQNRICLTTYFGDLRDNLVGRRWGCPWRPYISTWFGPRSNWTRALSQVAAT